METHKAISRRNRVRSACEAGKQQRIQHGNRVSRFYLQNIRIIDFSSKAVAFPYKPLQIQTVVTQYTSICCKAGVTFRVVMYYSICHVTLNSQHFELGLPVVCKSKDCPCRGGGGGDG